jgi:hypothetical protein
MSNLQSTYLLQPLLSHFLNNSSDNYLGQNYVCEIEKNIEMLCSYTCSIVVCCLILCRLVGRPHTTSCSLHLHTYILPVSIPRETGEEWLELPRPSGKRWYGNFSWLTLDAHAQRRLQYLVRKYVCLSVCYHVFCHHVQEIGKIVIVTVILALF